VFLPAYSPELNPCELVFAQVKRYIRSHRDGINAPLIDLIVQAFESVTIDNIINYYTKCIFVKEILPELSKNNEEQ
jgi:hypothetical protein